MHRGIGAVIVGLDIAVLVANVAILATKKEHPAAIEIKSKVAMLKDEQDQLQSLYTALQRSSDAYNDSYFKYGNDTII